MTTEAIPIGRISAFVRWVARTPWPVFTLGMLQADIIGALLVLGFLRFGLPPEDRVQLQDLPAFNLAIFLGYLFVSFTVASFLSLRLLIPVIRWQRRDTLLADRDPAVTELARSRALKMPFYRSVISVTNWCLGSIVFIVASWPVASHSAPVVAVATALGATATAIIGYLQSERVLRPVAVAALRGGVPENFHAPGVIQRQVLTWVLSTGVPVLAIVLAVVASKFEILTAPAERLTTPILLLAIVALVIGLAGTVLVAMSIADPLRQLRWALGEVQRGNYNAHMQIYDASELGLLQAGFNDMVRDLAERQRLRDLFGRYVGEDVARRALERGTELGGQERDVAVLFVDLVGSTQLASTRPAAEVVSLLNEFFRVVVDTVNRHGGFVNKFQGDAALCIFGAPIEHPDASGAALAASRELHDELIRGLGRDRVRHRGVRRPRHRRAHRRAGPLRVHRDRRPGQRGGPPDRAGQARAGSRTGVGDRGQRRARRRGAVLGRRRDRRTARPYRTDPAGPADEPGVAQSKSDDARSDVSG